MSAEDESGTGTLLTEDQPLPQPSLGEPPASQWEAPPDEAPEVPEGIELVPSPGWCWVQSKYNGVHVRSGANAASPSLGRLNAGDRLDAKWNAVTGARVEGCGGSGTWWIPVWWNGTWGYVPSLCVNYFRPN